MDLAKIHERSGKFLATTTLAGSLLLAPPQAIKYLPTPVEIAAKIDQDSQGEKPNPLKKYLLTP